MANIGDLNIELIPVMFGILSVLVLFALFRLMRNSLYGMTRVHSFAKIAVFAALMGLLMFGMPFMAMGAVQAVEIETPVLNFDGLPSTVEITGLTAETAYQLKFDDVNETQFETGSGQTEYTLYIVIDAPTDGTLKISVHTQAAATTLAYVEVQTPVADQFVPLDTYILIGTVAIILGAIVYFVNDIRRGRGLR